MSQWTDFFSVLRCLGCGGKLSVSCETARSYQQPGLNGQLRCTVCQKTYPLFQSIPVMFIDSNRAEVLIDRAMYLDHLKTAEKKMEQALGATGKALDHLKEQDALCDALSWEILFWERWKQSDEGFLEYSRQRIDSYLQHDEEGGGRLRYFERVLTLLDGAAGKRLLNIGAGRDFLLERFLNHGCEVVEQDILLEPLLYLKKRGATLCVCGDARNLPFADNIFDVATSFGTLHHIWPIEQPLAELLRVTAGSVHLNEPNWFAWPRAAHFLPSPIKSRLKRYCGAGLSPSPYENSINPYLLTRIARRHSGTLVDLSFPVASWIPSDVVGLKKALRKISLFLVRIFPLFSSHFEVVGTRKRDPAKKRPWRQALKRVQLLDAHNELGSSR